MVFSTWINFSAPVSTASILWPSDQSAEGTRCAFAQREETSVENDLPLSLSWMGSGREFQYVDDFHTGEDVVTIATLHEFKHVGAVRL